MRTVLLTAIASTFLALGSTAPSLGQAPAGNAEEGFTLAEVAKPLPARSFGMRAVPATRSLGLGAAARSGDRCGPSGAVAAEDRFTFCGIYTNAQPPNTPAD
jgi:hypothetical protein